MSTMVAYTQVRPKARPCVTVELPQLHGEGLARVTLMDLHCASSDCPCQVCVLYVHNGDYTRDPERWHEEATAIRVSVDVQTGAASVAGGNRLGECLQESLQIDDKLLGKLRKRRAEVKHWGQEHGWRFVDWTEFEPGMLMAYAEVFPGGISSTLENDGDTFFWDDHYCCTLGCACTQMKLALCRIGENASVGGYVTVDLSKGTAIEWLPVGDFPKARLRALGETVVHEHLPLLRERAAFMGGEFARHLHATVPRKVPAARVAPKAGRNDPCPCGSGKKFKKCCLAG